MPKVENHEGLPSPISSANYPLHSHTYEYYSNFTEGSRFYLEPFVRKYIDVKTLNKALQPVLTDLGRWATNASSLVDINYLVQYCNFNYW